MNNPQRIFMIGSGNVATHLAGALQAAGHRVVGVYSRTKKNADRLASTLQCSAFTSLTDIPEADVYIFAVKDDALNSLIAELTPSDHALLLHIAGSVPMEVFKGKAEHHGVLYPLQTFSRECAVCFREIPCFIEASTEQAAQQLKLLAESVSSHVQWLDSDSRKYLHLAAVFACNFTNHCYAMAWQMLQERGVDPHVLLPLIDETARKVHRLSPAAAQTGPAVRWDTSVMQRHLSLLKDQQYAGALYQLMSNGIHTLAAGKQGENAAQDISVSGQNKKNDSHDKL